MKRILSFIVIFCVIISMSACGQSKKEEYSVSFAIDGIPESLDPQIADSRSALTVIYNTFEGLTRLNADGKVSLAAAKNVDISDDGLTYTFTLREDMLWSDGKELSANDFVFGLRRAVSPETKCPSAESFMKIEGAQSVYGGTADISSLGVYTSDGKIVIKLASPDADLLRTLSLPAAMPCRKDFFEGTEGKYGRSASNYISNGPFYLKKWSKDTESVSLRISRNPDYNGETEVKPASVVFFFSTGKDHIVEISEDQMNAACISSDFYNNAESAGLNISVLSNTGYILCLNSAAPVFSSENMRKIFAASIDRSKIESSLAPGIKISQSIVPEGCYFGDEIYSSNGEKLIPFDETAAENYLSELALLKADLEYRIAQKEIEKDIAADGADPADNPSPAPSDAENDIYNLYSPWSEATEIVTDFPIIYPDNDALLPIVSAVANSWEKAFGIVVSPKALSESELTAAAKAGNYFAAVIPVSSADSEAKSVLYSFCSSSAQNKYKYADRDYDVYVRERFFSADFGVSDIKTAENYLISTAAVIPLVSGGSIIVSEPETTNINFAGSYGYIDFSDSVRIQK